MKKIVFKSVMEEQPPS